MSKLIMIQPSYSQEINGITTSVASRITHLLNHTNHEITLITFSFDPLWKTNALKFVPRHNRLKIINIYAELMEYENNQAFEIMHFNKLNIQANGIKKVIQKDNLIYINEQRKPILSGGLNEQCFNTYTHSTESKSPHRPSNFIYSPEGQLLCIKTYSHFNNPGSVIASQDTYFHKSGLPKIIHRYRPSKSNNMVLDSITLFTNGVPEKIFNRTTDIFMWWLKQYLNNVQEKSIFINDHVFLQEHLGIISNPNIKTISCLHSAHIKSELTNYNHLNAPLNPYNEWIFRHPNSFDRLLVLTKRQAKEINERFNFSDKIKVIPHTNKKKEQAILSKRNHSLCVWSGSFIIRKQPLEAIQIFKSIVQKYPKVVMEMYGEGPLQEKAQLLIKELNLENNIFIRGFSSNLSTVFQTAGILISTSLIEGYPMAMIEALNQGLPIIAYDADYGVDEIIQENINGYIIPKKNRDDFITKLSNLISSPSKQAELSLNATNSINIISDSIFTEEWNSLLNSIKF